MRIRPFTLCAVAALMLVGCTPIAPTPTPEPSPEPSGSASPTPTAAPSPEPEERADYGFTYFHEAEIGQNWEQMSAALRYPVSGMPECPYFGPVWQTASAFGSAFTDAENPTGGARMFMLMMSEDTNPSHYPRNTEDVGIGSTPDAVVAQYPSAVEGTYTDLGAGTFNTITVDDPESDSKYVFAYYDDDTVITMMQWGPLAGGQWSHLCGGF